MITEKIMDGNTILATLIRGEDWGAGLNFVSSENDYVQVGIWGYEKGKKLLPHNHMIVPRTAQRTQEVIFVREGRVRADIFTEQDRFLKSIELCKGDTLVLLGGGHGYEVLEDNTKVLEVKNGPYVGAEKDRRRIAPETG